MSMPSSSAKRTEDAKPSATRRFWREVRGYAEALAIAFLVVTFGFNTVGVVGNSMRPNLHGGSGSLVQALFTGDRVFIPKYETWLRRAGVMPMYERGEVVVVREPPNAPSAQFRNGRRPFFIKRLIAVPGDYLRIENGQVYVNGVPVDQSFITASGEISPDPIDFPVIVVENGQIVGFQGLSPGTFQGSAFGPQPVPITSPAVQRFYGTMLDAFAPLPEDAPEGIPFVHDIVIPDGYVFVMGDNRQSSRGGSEDSRYFGPVRFMTIAGRASAIIWPPQRNGEWNWRGLEPPAAFDAIPDAPSDTLRDR